MRPGLLVNFHLVVVVMLLDSVHMVLLFICLMLSRDVNVEAAWSRLKVHLRLVGWRGRPAMLEVLFLFPVGGALARGRKHGVRCLW